MVHEYCNLVTDLLPLYVDGLVSEESANVIKTHLSHCSDCQRQLQAMTVDIKPEPMPHSLIKRPFSKIKKIYVCRTIVATLIVLIISLVALSSYNSWRGAGMTMLTITASTTAGRAFEALRVGDYDLSLQLFDASVHSQQFVGFFQEVDDKGITIIDASVPIESFTMSGRSALGTVKLDIEDNGQLYSTYFAVRATDGKLTPLRAVQVYGPRDNGIGYALSSAEWPDWLLEIDSALGIKVSDQTFSLSGSETSSIRNLESIVADSKGPQMFWQLPGLNTQELEYPMNDTFVLYITAANDGLNRPFEMNQFSEFRQRIEAKGMDLIIIAYGWVDEVIDQYGDVDVPVLLATNQYLVREQIKGFPTLRVVSEGQNILWEQVGFDHNGDPKMLDALWNYLD